MYVFNSVVNTKLPILNTLCYAWRAATAVKRVAQKQSKSWKKTFVFHWFLYIYIFIYISFTQIQKFKQGDEVVVKSDEHLVKELQKEHAGWDESMISVSLIFLD